MGKGRGGGSHPQLLVVAHLDEGDAGQHDGHAHLVLKEAQRGVRKVREGGRVAGAHLLDDRLAELGVLELLGLRGPLGF